MLLGDRLTVNISESAVERGTQNAVADLLVKGAQFDAMVNAVNDALYRRSLAIVNTGGRVGGFDLPIGWALMPTDGTNTTLFESASFVAVLEEALRSVLPSIETTPDA